MFGRNFFTYLAVAFVTAIVPSTVFGISRDEWQKLYDETPTDKRADLFSRCDQDKDGECSDAELAVFKVVTVQSPPETIQRDEDAPPPDRTISPAPTPTVGAEEMLLGDKTPAEEPVAQENKKSLRRHWWVKAKNTLVPPRDSAEAAVKVAVETCPQRAVRCIGAASGDTESHPGNPRFAQNRLEMCMELVDAAGGVAIAQPLMLTGVSGEGGRGFMLECELADPAPAPVVATPPSQQDTGLTPEEARKIAQEEAGKAKGGQQVLVDEDGFILEVGGIGGYIRRPFRGDSSIIVGGAYLSAQWSITEHAWFALTGSFMAGPDKMGIVRGDATVFGKFGIFRVGVGPFARGMYGDVVGYPLESSAGGQLDVGLQIGPEVFPVVLTASPAWGWRSEPGRSGLDDNFEGFIRLGIPLFDDPAPVERKPDEDTKPEDTETPPVGTTPVR